jgi:hypothetical protein
MSRDDRTPDVPDETVDEITTDHTALDDTADAPAAGDASDADDAAGAELGRQMTALVSGVEITPALRARVAEGVMARPKPRMGALAGRPLAAAAAIVVLIAGALAFAAGGGDDADDLVIADERPQPSPPTTLAEDDADWPATVGGVVIVRPPAVGEELPAPPPPPVTEPAPVPQVAPPPTVPPCRDSVDPACGPFTWDPAPVVPQAELRFLLPSEPARVGVPYELVVELTDPGTMPSFNCASGVAVDPTPSSQYPIITLAGCVYEPLECPTRYGPWTPPAPRGGSVRTSVTITFDEPGSYGVAASARRPLLCDNVDPYGTDASGSAVVQVVP